MAWRHWRRDGSSRRPMVPDRHCVASRAHTSAGVHDTGVQEGGVGPAGGGAPGLASAPAAAGDHCLHGGHGVRGRRVLRHGALTQRVWCGRSEKSRTAHKQMQKLGAAAASGTTSPQAALEGSWRLAMLEGDNVLAQHGRAGAVRFAGRGPEGAAHRVPRQERAERDDGLPAVGVYTAPCGGASDTENAVLSE